MPCPLPNVVESLIRTVLQSAKSRTNCARANGYLRTCHVISRWYVILRLDRGRLLNASIKATLLRWVQTLRPQYGTNVSGHGNQDRRKIEKEAFDGRLLGIVATNALELGVDIGMLDAVIMFGFPRGGIASFVRRSLVPIPRF